MATFRPALARSIASDFPAFAASNDQKVDILNSAITHRISFVLLQEL
jgi:hypothetical protein